LKFLAYENPRLSLHIDGNIKIKYEQYYPAKSFNLFHTSFSSSDFSLFSSTVAVGLSSFLSVGVSVPPAAEGKKMVHRTNI